MQWYWGPVDERGLCLSSYVGMGFRGGKVNGVDSVCGGVSSIGGESRARGAVNVAVTKTCYYPTNMGSLRDTSILDTQMLHSTGVPRSSSVPLAMFRGRRQTRSSVDLNHRFHPTFCCHANTYSTHDPPLESTESSSSAHERHFFE